MIDCDKIRELLPWYANKTLSGDEAQKVALHLADCSSCRDELARIIHLMWEIDAVFAHMPTLPETIWNRVTRSRRGLTIARLDVGSFLLGVSFGLFLPSTGLPRLRSDLRFLGQRVKLFNKQKGGSK